MNIQEAKNIRLVDFLAGFGHEPVIQRGNSVWYKSPFRTEKEASFKVDLHKELWYDFGLGKGGDIITLAKEIYQTQDVSRVLRCIEDKRTVLKPVTVSCPFEKAYPAFQDLKIIPLANRILLAYLEERCIDTETARKVCKEAHFNRNGKNYFAIAFPNISGGYEIRNRYFKACIAPKDISRIISSPESGICYIFEGFLDFLVRAIAGDFLVQLESCRVKASDAVQQFRHQAVCGNRIASVPALHLPCGIAPFPINQHSHFRIGTLLSFVDFACCLFVHTFIFLVCLT